MVPDRIVLSPQGFVRSIDVGRKDHRETCVQGAGAIRQSVATDLIGAACLEAGQAVRGQLDHEGQPPRPQGLHGARQQGGRKPLGVVPVPQADHDLGDGRELQPQERDHPRAKSAIDSRP